MKCGYNFSCKFLSVHINNLVHTHLQCLGITSASLILSWRSDGLTAQDLDTNSFEFRGRVNTFVAVGFLTVLYAVVMVTVGLIGVKVHAKVVSS